MNNENELLTSKELREKLKGKVEVLNKVKSLFLLPNTKLATTKQVAEYYETTQENIRQLFVRNNDEFVEDGAKTIADKELRDIKSLSGLKTRARKITIFPLRAILRVGMLLRDSLVAKEVRTQLLNTMEHTTDEAKNFEIDKQKDLIFKVVMAKTNEDLLIAMRNYNQYMDKYKDYVDNAMNSPTGLTVSKIAKELGVKSGRELNKILAEKKIQYKDSSGQWLLYSKYADKGYTAPYTYTGKDNITYHSTNWTEKGKNFIYNLINK